MNRWKYLTSGGGLEFNYSSSLQQQKYFTERKDDKMKLKKFLSAVLSTALVLGTISVPAFAEEQPETIIAPNPIGYEPAQYVVISAYDANGNLLDSFRVAKGVE